MNMVGPEITDALAVLLEYPGEGHAARAREAAAVLRAQAPDLVPLLEPFLQHLVSVEVREQEELFTRTFDWAPERALELGWHLYGEQYERGAFMVRMRDLLRRQGVEEGQDLPDHLGTLLRLLGRLPPETAVALCGESLKPALVRLRAGFGSEPNPYVALLGAIEAAFGEAPAPAAGGHA
jgi:nitrate reductase delta subunit